MLLTLHHHCLDVAPGQVMVFHHHHSSIGLVAWCCIIVGVCSGDWGAVEQWLQKVVFVGGSGDAVEVGG